MKFFRLALVALALVASFAIVGCKGSDTAAPATTEGGAAAPAAPAEGAAK